MTDLPDLTAAVRFEAVADATREALTSAWKAWVEEAIAAGGAIPPGNAPGESKWQSRSAARPPRPEIKLTAGKAINVPIEELIDQVVKGSKVCLFSRRGLLCVLFCCLLVGG